MKLSDRLSEIALSIERSSDGDIHDAQTVRDAAALLKRIEMWNSQAGYGELAKIIREAKGTAR